MTNSTTSAGAILAPEAVGRLIIQPLIQQSVAGRALGVIQLADPAHDYRVPIVTADPSASWVAEGQEIPVSDADVEEIIVTPTKLAGLTVISSELARDSSPDAQQTVGNGLVRDLSRKLDEALFTSSTTNGPNGLPSVSDVGTHAAASTTADIVDAIIAAQYDAESHNAVVRVWVANPATATRLSSLKRGTDSNEPLLSNRDVTTPGARQLFGAPLITSPYAADNDVWGLDSAYSLLVIRQDAEIVADTSPFFTSDRVAVRATLRAGFAFAHPASIQKVTLPTPA
jgi:HK97 family phage major capsid protein